MPTERALGLKDPMQQLLEDLEGLTHHRAFTPRAEEMFFIVAASDMQRDLFFLQLLRDIGAEGISIALEFILSGHPTLARMRDAPSSWEEDCAADHVAVRFPDGGTSFRALTDVEISPIRKAMVSVPNFDAIPPLVQGTKLLVTEMNLMELCRLSSFDMAPLFVESDLVKVYLTWHRRSTNDPAHVWLRERIERIAAKVRQTKIDF